MTSYRMDVTSPCSDSDVTEGGANRKQNHPECITSQPTANGTLLHLNEGETVARITKSLELLMTSEFSTLLHHETF